MALSPIQTVSGHAVSIPGADIDTDRIIPARFMKCVTFDGLGDYAFYDVRVDSETGKPTDHPLNDERFSQASVLIAGVNFGCGSSREHAPQSLKRYGFDAIIAESFAEIFYGNSTTIGLPCVCAHKEDLKRLSQGIEHDPQLEVSIDLKAMTVTYSKESFPITMPDSARDALLTGRYDPLQELLEQETLIHSIADKLPYLTSDHKHLA